MFDILTIGAGTRDVFIKSSHFERMTDPDAPAGFDACFPMGAKIPLDDILFETGGGATNAAITFRNLGFKTACACCVGKDGHGYAVTKSLKDARVATNAVQVHPKAQTSYAIILLAGSGQRSILVYRGASNLLDPKKLSPKKDSAKWIYLTSMGGLLPKVRSIFSFAKKTGARIAWNPGNGELKHGLKKLSSLLKQTDILIVNREEAALLADKKPKDLHAIQRVLGDFPKIALVITNGPKGVDVYDPQSGRLMYSPAIPGKRVNTTGAGDAFGSGFVSGYLKSGSLEDAIAVGSLNSIGVITRMGAKGGILSQYPSQSTLKRIKRSIK